MISIIIFCNALSIELHHRIDTKMYVARSVISVNVTRTNCFNGK